MLGKLIKHEFKATYRTFLLMFIVLFGLTLVTKFCVFIPFDNMLFNIINVLLVVAYVIALVGIAFAAIAILLMRFYNNMLKDEGYLTNTLPVKMWQHLVAKLVSGGIWIIATFVAVILSISLFQVGEPEFVDLINMVIKFFEEVSNYPILIGVGIELLVMLIVQIFLNLINVYAAFSFGQLFKKHKIAGTVLFYFLINYIAGVIMVGLEMAIPGYVDKMDRIDTLSQNADTVKDAVDILGNGLSTFLLITLAIQIVLGIVYFFIANYMFSKKLNLE